MLKVKNLFKSYNSGFAISNISFEVEKGKIHGIIGENGSGKTTIIKCLTGIYRPESGEVLYDGKPIYDNPVNKSKIGYVADGNNYFPEYSVKEMAEFFSRMYKTFDMELFKQYNCKFELDLDRKMRQLSKGQNMKASFMLNMAMKPELIILDEPTAGLDVIAKRQLIDILIDNVEKRELAVVITSHHLDELERLCDTMTIVSAGSVIYNNNLEELKEKYRKYQVVLAESSYEQIKNLKGVVDVVGNGSIYTFVLDETCEDPVGAFNQVGAKFIEKVDMSIDDIFVYSILSQKVSKIVD